MTFQFTVYKFAVLLLVTDGSNLMDTSDLASERTIKIERFNSLI